MSTFDTTTVESGLYDALSAGSRFTTTPTDEDNASLDYEDYLSLITAEMENQDPFEPMSNAEMASQLNALAQLDSMEQLNTTVADGLASLQSNLGESLDGLNGSIESLNAALLRSDSEAAAAYIGRWVYAEGDTAVLYQEQPLAAQLEIPAGCEQLTVEILDPEGEVVATHQLDAPDGGLTEFTWDGRLGDLTQEAEEGYETAPGGRYTLSATATVDGETRAVTTYTAGYVTSARLNTDEGTLLEREGLSAIQPSQVTRLF